MPSLKDLKIRIDSVKSTRKITKAMQMVAAAKLRKAQEQAERGRPYAEKMRAIVSNLASSVKNITLDNKYLGGGGDSKKFLLIIATAERGLCGGFNSSIVKLAKTRIAELKSQNKEIKILTIGKKGREQLNREFDSLFIGHVDLSNEKNITIETARKISIDLISRFDNGEYEVAEIFYNKFASVISQIPSSFQLLPVSFNEKEADTGNVSNVSFNFEPDEDEILNEIIPKSIATSIFSVLQENAASEQGSRMAAMDNATRNAGEMIDKLTIDFNRSRQAAITNELIEIISGAEAL